jgi:GNAT superfamily N-acetyltransferase
MLALVRELAAYEREPAAVAASEDDLRRALFGPDPLVHALVGETMPAGEHPVAEQSAGEHLGPQIVGVAIWFVTYSTWTGRHGIWLEDLFVTPEHRSLGVGQAMLAELAAECVRRGYPRLEWNVLDWNESAVGFYRRLGATPLADWTVHRLTGEPLRTLATTSARQP